MSPLREPRFLDVDELRTTKAKPKPERTAQKGTGSGIPTGGGWGGDDGDNWQNSPQDHRGPRERLHTYRIGIALTLTAISIFFLTTAALYLLLHQASPEAADGIRMRAARLPLPRILWLNTFLLLLSHATMEMARRGHFDENYEMEEWLGLGSPTARHSLPWLSATLILGIAFLAGQLTAWNILRARGGSFSFSGDHFFYLISGAHALHLFAGLIALGYAWILSAMKRELAVRQVAVDATAWYWHGMGVIWDALFLLLWITR